MSSYQFPDENNPPDTETILLTDESGKSLPCYVEQALESEGVTYLLLQPVDIPITFIAWDDEDDDSEATWIEDEQELDEVYDNAKAVLAEQNLTLKRTAYTFTVAGELPALEEDDILSLDIESDNSGVEPEEFQYLTSFFHNDQEYGIYTPLTPLLFFAKQTGAGRLTLLSPEEFETVHPLLEELLFEDLD